MKWIHGVYIQVGSIGTVCSTCEICAYIIALYLREKLVHWCLMELAVEGHSLDLTLGLMIAFHPNLGGILLILSYNLLLMVFGPYSKS